MIITKAALQSAATQYGAWTQAQLDLLGVGWPPRHGWQDRLVGQEVADELWVAFVAARNIRKGKRTSEKLGCRQADVLSRLYDRLKALNQLEDAEAAALSEAMRLLDRISDQEYVSVIRRKLPEPVFPGFAEKSRANA